MFVLFLMQFSLQAFVVVFMCSVCALGNSKLDINYFSVYVLQVLAIGGGSLGG